MKCIFRLPLLHISILELGYGSDGCESVYKRYWAIPHATECGKNNKRIYSTHSNFTYCFLVLVYVNINT